MDYKDILLSLQKDSSNLNTEYNKFILSKIEDFKEYASITELLVKEYYKYNDYLHSNNLLQLFKINANNHNQLLSDYIFYDYYCLQLYSKRYVNYYIDNPIEFWETALRVRDSNTNYASALTILLPSLLNSLKEKKNIDNLLKYYIENIEYNKDITSFINSMIDNNSFIETNNSLPKDKMIIVVYMDHFISKTNIKNWAKECKIDENQLRIIQGKQNIKSNGENIIKAANNKNYVGIIFGAIPHKASGIEYYSNIITKLESEPGYPLILKCTNNDYEKRLKMSKNSFIKNIKQIIDYANQHQLIE